MKLVFCFFTFLLLNFVFAQVPPPSYESSLRMGEAQKPPREETDRASSYSTNGKHGFINPDRTRQELIYDKINSVGDAFIVQKDGKFGLADAKGKIILPVENDSIFQINYKSGNGLIIKKKNKYGTIDRNGKTILSPHYDKILFAHENLPYSLIHNKKQIQLIFNESEKTFPKNIEYAEIYNNLIILKSDGKYGVVAHEKIILPFEYDAIFQSISSISETKKLAESKNPPTEMKYISSGKAHNLIVQKGEKFGLVDEQGKEVFKTEYDKIYFDGGTFSHNYYSLKKDNLWGAYFSGTKKLIPVEFSSIHPDGSSIFKVTKNGKMGIYNRNADLIVSPEYESVYNLSSTLFIVTKDRKKGLLDEKGKMLIPAIYDDLDNFYEGVASEFFKVKIQDKMGIVNLKNEVIIPIEYNFVGITRNYFRVITPEPERKNGLYDLKGNVIVPAEYTWISESSTEDSKLLILNKDNHSYNFLGENGNILLSENIQNFGYLLNQDKLLNPYSSNGKKLLYFKDKKGKFGILNEKTEKLSVPAEYDSIYQKIEDRNSTYLKVRKGKKFGLINDENQVILPIRYDELDIDLLYKYDETSVFFVVSKGKKYGTVDLNNKTVIPYQYTDLKRISFTGIYKAKDGKHFKIINDQNKVLNEGPFDEVAKFENTEHGHYKETKLNALTFYNGKMKVIDSDGNFVSGETPMNPHNGFTSFEELKKNFVEVMNSKEDESLRDFATKIAPSEHILYFLKNNVFNEQPLHYLDIDHIIETYYQELLKFKYQDWNSSYDPYKRESWTKVNDFTVYERGFITNQRTEELGYSSRILERLFRNSYKINGFWISSYFMSRHYGY